MEEFDRLAEEIYMRISRLRKPILRKYDVKTLLEWTNEAVGDISRAYEIVDRLIASDKKFGQMIWDIYEHLKREGKVGEAERFKEVLPMRFKDMIERREAREEIEGIIASYERELEPLGVKIVEAKKLERLEKLAEETKRLRKKIKDLRHKLRELRPERLAELTERINKLEADLKRKESELKEKQSEYERVKSRLEFAERRISELESKLPTIKPRAVPFEILRYKKDFWTSFQAELIKAGVSPYAAPRYRPVFEDEFKHLLRDVEMGVTAGMNPIEFMERELRKRAVAVARPSPPPAPRIPIPPEPSEISTPFVRGVEIKYALRGKPFSEEDWKQVEELRKKGMSEYEIYLHMKEKYKSRGLYFPELPDWFYKKTGKRRREESE